MLDFLSPAIHIIDSKSDRLYDHAQRALKKSHFCIKTAHLQNLQTGCTSMIYVKCLLSQNYYLEARRLHDSFEDTSIHYAILVFERHDVLNLRLPCDIVIFRSSVDGKKSDRTI